MRKLFAVPVVTLVEAEDEAGAYAEATEIVAAMTSVQEVATFRVPDTRTADQAVFLRAEDLATIYIGPFANAREADTHAAERRAAGEVATFTIVLSVPTDEILVFPEQDVPVG